MPHPKFDAHDVSIASDALIPSSTVAFSPVADTADISNTADTAAGAQQAQAASHASYQRPALTRVGQWQSVTLVISIPSALAARA